MLVVLLTVTRLDLLVFWIGIQTVSMLTKINSSRAFHWREQKLRLGSTGAAVACLGLYSYIINRYMPLQMGFCDHPGLGTSPEFLPRTLRIAGIFQHREFSYLFFPFLWLCALLFRVGARPRGLRDPGLFWSSLVFGVAMPMGLGVWWESRLFVPGFILLLTSLRYEEGELIATDK